MRVFVDTSYFIARAMPADQWHHAARQVKPAGKSFLTSSLVVNETISLLQQRGYFSAAIQWLREIRRNSKIQILPIDPALQAQAWDGFERWGGFGANAVDCCSFALMESLEIRHVLTFDRHFRQAGFKLLVDGP